MAVAKTLAYYDTAIITVVKSSKGPRVKVTYMSIDYLDTKLTMIVRSFV
jgi:hypothetical protein